MDRAQEADVLVEQVEEDDQGDSGTSFSIDRSGAEDKELRNRWFPLRPSAVGEDDEDTSHVAYTASAPAQQSSSDRLQGIPHAWSDDDAKQTPPERSQPDGRDGPDLKRTPWMASTYVGRQQTVAPPPQTLPQTDGTLGSRDSGSDTSILSQPQNDTGNVTPLDVITRSVPPVPKGASLIGELKHRHAPQLNSDSDTESPVSKLLGPNFRAVQEVLNRLKQDRLSDSVSNDADNSGNDQQSSREESLQSHGTSTERKKRAPAHQLGSQIKTFPSADAAASSFEIPSSRPLGVPYLPETQMQQGDMLLKDGSQRSDTSNTVLKPGHEPRRTSAMSSHRDPPEMIPSETTPLSGMQATGKFSQEHSSPNSTLSSITSARAAGVEYRASSGNSSEKLSQRDSARTVPLSRLQTSYKYSGEQRLQSSIDTSLKSSKTAWVERSTTGTKMKELLYHKERSASTGLPSSVHTSKEQQHEATPRSSIGSNFLPTKAAWSERKLSTSSTARELSADGPNAEVPGVIPADVLLPPGRTSSDLVHGTKGSPNSQATLSSLAEKSNDSHRTARQHAEPFQQEMDSDRSASSDNTDDLLTYEPVFEGDRQYLQMLRRMKDSGSKHRQSDAGDHHGNRLPVGVARDTESVTRLSGQEQPPFIPQGQEGLQGTPVDLNDSHIKALHWSLGAGTISPISFPSAGQLDSQLGKSSTPLSQSSKHSSVHEAGVLQEQSLEEDDYTAQSEDRDEAPLKQRASHSNTEVSSSDEIYRPVLYRDASGNKENHPDASALKTTSYGIYDIRRSSGPGSTNRRRKALGLEPNPTREAVSQEGNGLVYISGSSTPSSLQDVRGRYLGREDAPTRRPTDYQEKQPDQEYYNGRPERKAELRKSVTKGYEPVKQAKVLRTRQGGEVLGERDFPDPRRDEYTSSEGRRFDGSHRRQERIASSEDLPVSGSSPEQEEGPLYYRSDRAGQLPEKYIDRTDPHRVSRSLSHGKRSASSGKSRSRHMEDGFDSISHPARVGKTTASRKHHSETSGAKTGHSSRNKSDFRGSNASRLDANISKLSSLVSRSLDESISSSSQTSSTSALRRPPLKGKRAKMSSSTSETSDVSEFFNYAFFEPRFRHSIGRKLQLRELLRSVKARDISPIARRSRDTTTSESTSAVSSNEERESVPVAEQEPSHTLTQPRQSETVAEKQFFTTKPAAGPKCTCSRKVVTQATSPGVTQYSRQEHDDRESRMLQKRDVGVNFPTPIVTRHRSSSSDEEPRVQMEDASTQTDEVSRARKVNRKTDSEPEKSRPKPLKSKRNIDEHGVISQPSPKKPDYPYVVEQREKRRPKERLIPSQNSPDHSIKTSSDTRNRTQEPAWFYPMTVKPQTEQRTATQLNSASRTRDEFRVDVFDSVVNSSSSLQKLTLQEAFLYARPQFAKRSQERVARIEEAAREKERRIMIAEATREENRKEAAEMRIKTTPSSPKAKTRVKSGKCIQK